MLIMQIMIKKNTERAFRSRAWYSRNSSVWLMYHTPATDGRWCRWGRDTVSPCIRAYILIGPLSDHLRVDVITRRGNQTLIANVPRTVKGLALQPQSSLHYIIDHTMIEKVK